MICIGHKSIHILNRHLSISIIGDTSLASELFCITRSKSKKCLIRSSRSSIDRMMKSDNNCFPLILFYCLIYYFFRIVFWSIIHDSNMIKSSSNNFIYHWSQDRSFVIGSDKKKIFWFLSTIMIIKRKSSLPKFIFTQSLSCTQPCQFLLLFQKMLQKGKESERKKNNSNIYQEIWSLFYTNNPSQSLENSFIKRHNQYCRYSSSENQGMEYT